MLISSFLSLHAPPLEFKWAPSLFTFHKWTNEAYPSELSQKENPRIHRMAYGYEELKEEWVKVPSLKQQTGLENLVISSLLIYLSIVSIIYLFTYLYFCLFSDLFIYSFGPRRQRCI